MTNNPKIGQNTKEWFGRNKNFIRERPDKAAPFFKKSKYKWENILSGIDNIKNDCIDNDDIESFEQITNRCGLCNFCNGCNGCPLVINGQLCFQHGLYKQVYKAMDRDDPLSRDKDDDNEDRNIKHVPLTEAEIDLIETYGKVLVRYLDECLVLIEGVSE